MKKTLLFTISLFLSAFIFGQSCSDLFISEYIEGWSNNKALEIYNPTNSPVDLSGYRIVRYSNGQNVPPPEQQWLVELEGTIQPYRTYVVVIDQRDTAGSGQTAPVWDDLQDRANAFICPNYDISWAMYFNGDDALTLEKSNGDIVDIFGKFGERPLNEDGGTSNPTGGWSTVFPHSTGEGVIITRDHTMSRKSEVDQGVTTNPAHFDPMLQYDTLNANTFTNLCWHESVCQSSGNNKPEFTENNFEFSLPQGSPEGTSVGFVEAVDADDNAVEYFITWGNPFHPFRINRSTGEILVDRPEEVIAETYILDIDATDGTAPVSATVTISVSNSIDEADLFEIAVSPNPVTNQLFKVSANTNIVSVSIFDMSGRVYQTTQNPDKSNEMNVFTNGFATGLYLVKITLDNEKSFAKKITFQ